ncbi:MAG: hypothetical protein LBP37_01535, partial [Spirochaetaceae bacterium]|nr:hypothetical protein [Spirochaetaceae bacterium]
PPPPNSAGRTTEQRNYFAEFKARLYFVLSYSLLSHRLWFNVNLQTAYKMLKNRPSAVNMIKFIYRFFRHTVCVILFSPITFAIALIEQFNFGKR